MAVRIETPPQLKGDEAQKIAAVYSYLFRLSENLNVALNNLNADNFASAKEYNLVNSGGSGNSLSSDEQTNLAHNYRELRSLIVNTAEIIRSEMDKLKLQLDSRYEAISGEWGTYQENITNTIEMTAQGILQSYGYDAKIDSLQEAAAGFSQYIITTEGYIRQGFIDYDENNIPIIGIAIGQGLTTQKVTINGEEYEQIDSTQSCAFYTADKVSFRINGEEVAYISNNKLFIHDIEITGEVLLNSKWLITSNSRFTIKRIGAK